MVRQIAGMRGLVANPKGEIIPPADQGQLPRGLTVLEYFISTHGARKGLADTRCGPRTRAYLTRRLVDVSQDVIIRRGGLQHRARLHARHRDENSEGKLIRDAYAETSVWARRWRRDVTAKDAPILAEAGMSTMGDVLIGNPGRPGCPGGEGPLRSSPCDSRAGTCAKCYGRSLATGKLVDVGEAIGIVAAQSIGEPGTQLTMRTFHTGGVAGDDITQGLRDVVELFEARVPRARPRSARCQVGCGSTTPTRPARSS